MEELRVIAEEGNPEIVGNKQRLNAVEKFFTGLFSLYQ